jgi:hypothetical protein
MVKAALTQRLASYECGRQDSNLHGLPGSPRRAPGSTATGFQVRRVCRFHHARVVRGLCAGGTRRADFLRVQLYGLGPQLLTGRPARHPGLSRLRLRDRAIRYFTAFRAASIAASIFSFGTHIRAFNLRSLGLSNISSVE